MKKIIAVLTLIAVGFTVFAAAAAENSGADRLAQIKARGYIEIATEPYFAPYEFIDPSKSGDDKFVGLDIEIAKAIAKEIGVELKIVPLDFTAVLAGVTSGKYDMAISAISWSPTREEAMNLSEGYMFTDTGYGFIIRTEDLGKYNSIEDLKNAVVITQSGSVQESIFNDQITEKNVKEFKRTSQMTDGYLAVQEGKADVCICSTTSAQLYADANGNVLCIPDFRFTVDKKVKGTVCAAPLEGSDSLIAIANKIIDENTANGNIGRWFDESSELAKSLGIK